MRYLDNEIIRLFAEEQKMCFLAGPRQVGKTTLAKYLLKEFKGSSEYFNWDIESDRRLIIRYPEDFWKRRSTTPERVKKVVLDEIHKFPRWKRFLKGLYDAHNEELEILVTGSGKLDVYQRGGDSLLGRYHLYHLHPFTVGELVSSKRSEIFTPDAFIERIMDSPNSRAQKEALRVIETFTGFPEPLFAGSETRLRRWSNSHEQLVIREELRDLTRIREIGLIESLVSLLPERIGSPLSINALREVLGVRFETVQNWLSALARLFYLFSIRPYSGKLSRTLRREEKVYLYDFSTIEDPGPRFENIVALHLLKLCHGWTELGYGTYELWYVRDREKREVDFLITERRKPFALIETKLSSSDIDSSLRYFKDRLKPKHTIQIVRNNDDLKAAFSTQGIILAPAAQMLATL